VIYEHTLFMYFITWFISVDWAKFYYTGFYSSSKLVESQNNQPKKLYMFGFCY